MTETTELKNCLRSNGSDYHWTKEVMDKVKHQAQGFALHYYTLPTGDWGHKGSSTEFDIKGI